MNMTTMRQAIGCLIAIAAIPTAVGAAIPPPQELSQKSIPVCPQEIPLRDITVKWPAGWQGEVAARFKLNGVSVIVGAEANHEGDIIPEDEKHKGELVVYYSGLDSFGTHQRWLSCAYGRDADLRLFKKIPFDIKECVIRYSEIDGSPGSYELKSYRCK